MPTTRKSSSSRKRTVSRTKARRPAMSKIGAIKSKSRQHYSEVGARAEPLRSKVSRIKARPALAKARAKVKLKARVIKAKAKHKPATRELFSDLAKVGRQIKRRVKRAL